MTYLEAIMSGALDEPNNVNMAAMFEYLDSQRDVIAPAVDGILNAAAEVVDLESEDRLGELIDNVIVNVADSMVENKDAITKHIINMLNLEYDPDEIPETPKLVRVK